MKKAVVLKPTKIVPHPNSDNGLQLALFNNEQVIGKFNEGDLYIYFESGLILSNEYCQFNGLFIKYGIYDNNKNLIRELDYGENAEDKVKIPGSGYMPFNKAVIKAQNLRGEKSYGLAMPLSSLDYIPDIDTSLFIEGYSFNDIIIDDKKYNICDRYSPYANYDEKHKTPNIPKIKYSNIYNHMYKEHYDTEKLSNGYNKLLNLSELYDINYIITKKLHGTSGIYANVLCKNELTFNPYNKENDEDYQFYWYDDWFNSYSWRHVIGTRRVLLNDKVFSGFYGSNQFRYNAVEGIKLLEGETIYYEIVGYTTDNKPIQSQKCKSELKDIIKQFGKQYDYDYNCSPSECTIYVYRITMTGLDGISRDYTWEEIKNRCNELGIKYVPEVEINKLTPDKEYDYFNNLANKNLDVEFPNHLNEGIVVRFEYNNGLVNRQETFKCKNFWFLLNERHSEEAGVLDIEEVENFESDDNKL